MDWLYKYALCYLVDNERGGSGGGAGHLIMKSHFIRLFTRFPRYT